MDSYRLISDTSTYRRVTGLDGKVGGRSATPDKDVDVRRR
jgi:hypothetical protein